MYIAYSKNKKLMGCLIQKKKMRFLVKYSLAARIFFHSK